MEGEQCKSKEYLSNHVWIKDSSMIENGLIQWKFDYTERGEDKST